MTLVVVTGTGTEVGKTFVTAALARDLRAIGLDIRARKPVQSFAPGDLNTDADVLAEASGDLAERVCPRHRWYATPMAPPMAADALGLPTFTIDDLASELDSPRNEITLVEGAGGLCSPLAHDGDTRALIEACRPAIVVLVADAGLGTINLVRLCVAALGARYVPIVFVNRFVPDDELHRRNVDWMRTREGLEIVTDPEALCMRLAATRGLRN